MSNAAARPTVSVFDAAEGETKVVANVALPSVLTAPIRPDVVQFVHTNIAKNKRQAYAVYHEAGMQTAAESWGTGRAVSRIPRVPGGGTHRAGQAAFGNMCRGGRMYSNTRPWRKWHKKVNLNQRRYAICSAVAASAVPALVMARGHRVMQVPELPLVVGGAGLDIKKTKEAVALLERFGAGEDVQRVKDSKKIRAGTGKMRNRRFTKRRGPLVIHASTSSDLCKAFRNIEGVDLCHVDRLNILQLAPGGHLGRFVVWTQDAFAKLDALYGTHTSKATEKSDYSLPRPCATVADIGRIIESDEVQKACTAPKTQKTRTLRKKNALRNVGVKTKLNPYTVAIRRAEAKAAEQKKVRAKKVRNTREERQAFYEKLIQ
jgi:large subunit ribosomal protein L4e